jgi:hypothetical protein
MLIDRIRGIAAFWMRSVASCIGAGGLVVVGDRVCGLQELQW